LPRDWIVILLVGALRRIDLLAEDVFKLRRAVKDLKRGSSVVD
jgi:hypothetical protein